MSFPKFYKLRTLHALTKKTHPLTICKDTSIFLYMNHLPANIS